MSIVMDFALKVGVRGRGRGYDDDVVGVGAGTEDQWLVIRWSCPCWKELLRVALEVSNYWRSEV